MEYEEFMNMQCGPAQAKNPQTNDEYAMCLEARIAEKSFALEKMEKDLADAEKKYKKQEAALNDVAAKYTRAEAEKKNIEHKLKNADEIIRSFCKPGMPAEVRISAHLKYLELAPGNLYIAGILHNNIAAILGNELRRYEEAKEHFKKAISFAQQECIADPSNVSAKVRLEQYEYRLEDCIYNIKTMKSSPGQAFIVAA